jgi:hypothetical protein
MHTAWIGVPFLFVTLAARGAELPRLSDYPVEVTRIDRYADTVLPDARDPRFNGVSRIFWYLPSCVKPLANPESLDKPGFADRYTVFESGCGTACMFFCLIDRISGVVYPGLARTGPVELRYARDSRLMIFSYTGWNLAAENDAVAYHADCYLWDHDHLRFLSRFRGIGTRSRNPGTKDWEPVIAAGPENPDFEPPPPAKPAP